MRPEVGWPLRIRQRRRGRRFAGCPRQWIQGLAVELEFDERTATDSDASGVRLENYSGRPSITVCAVQETKAAARKALPVKTMCSRLPFVSIEPLPNDI